jgi:MSHA biogenesis protein MshQ
LLSPLSGVSNAFVVAPAAFAFSAITGSPIQAGASFSAKLTAVTSTGIATPNFGAETVPESATVSLGARVAPAGTNDCTNGPCDGVVAGNVSLPWTSGVATASNLSYSEVGQITLAATLASGSYLGSGKTATGTSATVGDFVPAYFDTAVTPACASFTYSGQPFSQVFVTAKNTSGATTLNYSNLAGCAVCSKSVTLYDPTAVANFNASNTLAASAFAKGVGASNSVSYTFPTKKTAPATITLRAVDASVTPNITSNVLTATYPLHVEATAALRSGRIHLLNAYGSELLDLPLTLRAEYWDGNSWAFNSADVCTGDTTLNANNGVSIALTKATLDPSKTCVWDSASPGLSSSGCASAAIPSKKYTEGATPSIGFVGDFNLWLKAPGKNNSGAVDVSATVPIWLRYNWTGTVANPAARATFGIYKSPIIYLRENY